MKANEFLRRRNSERAREPLVIEAIPFRTVYLNKQGDNIGKFISDNNSIVSTISLPRVKWLERAHV